MKWIAPVISIVVAISAGVTAYFKYKERSFNLQQTADAIEQEYVAVDLGIGYYKGKQQQEALELFAERVELLKDEQKKREQQLEQPPDVKHS
ncbi:MAG TPA: SLATT domain-containing protein [Ktedonobacteraceae bacterium]